MNLLQLFGQSDRSTRPFHARRRQPLVEALEGRQVLSGFTVTPAIVGSHIGYNTAGIVGQHIGMTAGIQGAHIGSVAAIQGQHIGYEGVVADHIQGQHIG